MKLLGLLLCSAAWAGLQAQEAVVTCPRERDAVRMVGGRAATLELQVSSAKAQTVTVRAALYQLAGRIAAPLAKDLQVATNLACDGGKIQPVSFAVTPPEVKQATSMELRFTAQRPAEGAVKPAGSLRLVVYPKDLLARIAATVAQAKRPIVVLGESPRLKRALRLAGATFDEAAEAPPHSPALYLAEDNPSSGIPTDVHFLFFMEDPALPAGVYQTIRENGVITKVTFPVLADFETSPDRQLLFDTLLQQTLSTP